MTAIRLFVDDIRECPKGWQVARTVTDAIRILAQQNVTEVSLDHDIIEHFGKASKETFEPVAWYLALLWDYRKQCLKYENNRFVEFPKVRIHTSNPAGGQRMATILGLYYRPYMYRPEDYEETDESPEAI